MSSMFFQLFGSVLWAYYLSLWVKCCLLFIGRFCTPPFLAPETLIDMQKIVRHWTNPPPFSLMSVANSFSLFFIHRILFHLPSPTNYVGTSLQRESKPGLSHWQFLYFISCVVISSRVRQLTPAINARSSNPNPISRPQFRIFGNVFRRGGDWLIIAIDEFLITFALILQLHPQIT